MASREPERRSSTQALMRGLSILSILVESARPMSATELAQQTGLHQSSVSRILATLSEGGYVRKESYRSFAPDYGILALANTAGPQFAIAERPQRVMQDAIDAAPEGLTMVLAMLWRNQLLYFLRTTKGQDPVRFEGRGYPLSISAPAMRMIADMPDEVALELLSDSRRRYGWPVPDPHLPRDEREALVMARRLLSHDVLIDDGWTEEDYVAAAILLKPHDGHPLSLAVYGPRSAADDDTLRLLLHTARREVEATF